jgi:hypothetical protein
MEYRRPVMQKMLGQAEAGKALNNDGHFQKAHL